MAMKGYFVVIAPRSTLIWSGSAWKGHIDGSNKTVWHLKWVQTNDLFLMELLEIERFDHLTECKQMTDV